MNLIMETREHISHERERPRCGERSTNCHLLTFSDTEEVSLEIRYRVVKRAATLATGPRRQKLAAD